jgi:predicted ester cyclase
MLKAAFPDAHWEILELIAEGDAVAMHVAWSGTHRGPFMGLEPTGRSFSDVHHVYLFRVRGGKVTEYKAVRDDVSLMRQLGQVPQAA